MSRIVIDARESGTTTGRYVDKLIENIAKIDKNNHYTLLLKKHRLAIYSGLPKNFTVKECSVEEFSFAEQTRLLWQIVRLHPDLVHFPLVQHPVLYFGRSVIGMLDLTTLRFRNPSKNFVVFWLKQKVYWFVNFVATRKAKKIITISNFVRDDAVKHFRADPNKIITTYNAADFIDDSPAPIDGLKGKKFIMYVGRHQPHKNLQRLIDAHQLLLKDHPDLLLAIVGKPDATTELLKKKNEKAGMKNVVFTGYVSDAQLRWAYGHVAAYVFPSLSEGFGLPGLEAMAHGAPVVSSNATCLPEIYGVAALYFDPLNVQDIANKVDNMLINKLVRDDCIQKGYVQAKKYSWRRTAEQTLEVYRSALSD